MPEAVTSTETVATKGMAFFGVWHFSACSQKDASN